MMEMPSMSTAMPQISAGNNARKRRSKRANTTPVTPLSMETAATAPMPPAVPASTAVGMKSGVGISTASEPLPSGGRSTCSAVETAMPNTQELRNARVTALESPSSCATATG